MPKVDEATIAELKQKHGGRLYLLTDEDGDDYVAKAPTEPEVERFLQDGGNKDGNKLDAFKGLAATCVVWPEDFDQVVVDYPFIVVTLGNKLAELAKLHEKVKAKKL